LDQIRRGESIEAHETVRLRRDGRLREVSVSLTPLRDGSGRITGAIALERNISERKRTESYLLAQQALTRVLAESGTLQDAAPRLLQVLGDLILADMGVLWA